MHGRTRLIFNDFGNHRRVDIFLDVLRMCHELDFRKRLKIGDLTLSPSDLLATKLQIVQVNQKDFKDMLALLLDHEIMEEDGVEAINAKYIAELCSRNWGLHRTFSQTLRSLLAELEGYELDEESKRIARRRAEKLCEYVKSAPKSLQWKARALIGEKMIWYDEPDADKPVVDSRPFTERLVDEDVKSATKTET